MTSSNEHVVSGRHRWHRVDMLRGIAVLLVVCRHHEATGLLNEHGWLGVDLFFVLSGFLVSGLIFDEYERSGRFDGARFLIRRGFKIYPSFYLFILVTTVLIWITGGQRPINDYLAELFFFQNYHEGLWPHTWSLAVEEHFYLLLVLAAMVLIATRVHFRWRAMLMTCVALFVAFLLMRVITNAAAPFHLRTHTFVTHLRLDSLLAGVLLAAWHRYRPVSFQRVFSTNILMLCGIMLVLLLPIFLSDLGSWAMATIGLSGAYLAGAVAVGAAVARSGPASSPSRASAFIGRWLVRPLAWAGGISYTTYLWQILVRMAVALGAGHIGLAGSMLEFLAFLVGSLALGWLASVLVEQPFLRLRERWFPRTRLVRDRVGHATEPALLPSSLSRQDREP